MCYCDRDKVGPSLAEILTKFDALRALSEVQGSDWNQIMSNTGAAYQRGTSASRHDDDDDGQLLHEEECSLLLRLHGAFIVNAVETLTAGT